MQPGEPVFLRLTKPRYAIAGYGFFAHFELLELDVAWDTFGARNGFADRDGFCEALGEWRGGERFTLRADGRKLACTILRDAVFWPESRWLPWGAAQGWPRNVTQGATIRDPKRIDELTREVQFDHHLPPEDFAPSFVLLDVDDREIVQARARMRVGQGAFRTRLLTAYGARCAISGERTEPVLDAAHVQPYLGPRSNHLQNGMLLTKELHALFDRGLVTVTPDHIVRVSPRIRDRWSNGKRYYEFDGERLRALPDRAHERPSADALKWHNERRFAS